MIKNRDGTRGSTVRLDTRTARAATAYIELAPPEREQVQIAGGDHGRNHATVLFSGSAKQTSCGLHFWGPHAQNQRWSSQWLCIVYQVVTRDGASAQSRTEWRPGQTHNLPTLIRAKKATGRPKDREALLELDVLRKLRFP